MNPAFRAKQRVDRALEALRVGLGPYVVRCLEARYGANWRSYASRAAGVSGGELDTYALLKTLLDNFQELFRQDPRMRKARSYISIALDARNAVAHFDGHMEEREALRYLDAIREVLAAIGAQDEVGVVDALYDEQKREAATAAPGEPRERAARDSEGAEPATGRAPSRLRPWREVVQPHPDVLTARFTDAEFAANLAHVDQGLGSEEYTDPLAFFRITYVTEGLRRVLGRAVERFAGQGGDPVIGLQTNFGGGKTHTLLALYHLAGATAGRCPLTDLPGLAEILNEKGVKSLPPARRAVFVGTHKGPSEAMHRSDGREVRTVWGYLAYQLGGWSAVDEIAASEANRTNPGSEKLVAILRAAAPCLILLDEVVAFAKQLRGEEYEAFHAFLQSLTEAAAAVPRAMVVGSLPQSKVEVGDARGEEALRRLEKLFGRVQSPWTPASDVETFEIVRRRLFQPLDEEGEKARDATIQAFGKFYREHAADFPPEVTTPAYREEMRRAYPIHPEILERFSKDWSTLEQFQRTRGILKIMANAIYALWRAENNAPLITLGLLPLGEEKVRTAILEPLDPAYRAILQAEVEGEMSLPARLEAERQRFGKTQAATRAARALFLATAPHRGSAKGAVGAAALHLACAVPGDQLAIFLEAVRVLAERSAYLYREGDRYWFSTQPTLNRLAEERAKDLPPEEVDAQITEFLRREQREKGGFHRVYAAPDDLLEIDDTRALGLVILPPTLAHAARGAKAPPSGATPSEDTPAQRAILDTLQRRGPSQRKYRNALVFVAADRDGLETCRELARSYLAWKSIVADKALEANMTGAQREHAKSRCEQLCQTLQQRIRSTWSHVFYPVAASDGETGVGVARGFALELASVVNRAPGKPIAPLVYDKLRDQEIIVEQLGPDTLLASLREVWHEDKPHIEVATLIDYFASFVYLPRLRDETTLIQAIEKLVGKLDGPVGFAKGFDPQTGAYREPVRVASSLGSDVAQGLLVWRSALPEPAAPAAAAPASAAADLGAAAGDRPRPADPGRKKPRRFFASIPLDPRQPGLQVAKIAENILVELGRPHDANLQLTLEIHANAPDGYPPDVVEVVHANLRDLRMEKAQFNFEEQLGDTPGRWPRAGAAAPNDEV